MSVQACVTHCYSCPQSLSKIVTGLFNNVYLMLTVTDTKTVIVKLAKEHFGPTVTSIKRSPHDGKLHDTCSSRGNRAGTT